MRQARRVADAKVEHPGENQWEEAYDDIIHCFMALINKSFSVGVCAATRK